MIGCLVLLTSNGKAVENDFTKPLVVPKGKLYAFQELDKNKLESELKKYTRTLRVERKKKRNNSSVIKNRSFVCHSSEVEELTVLPNDDEKLKDFIIKEIIGTPQLGEIIVGTKSLKFRPNGKTGLDSFKYVATNQKSGATEEGIIKILVISNWENSGKYNIGNDASVYRPPSRKFTYKQVRSPYHYFFVNIKPIFNALKGETLERDRAFVFTTKSKGKDSLPGGYAWNYPIDKFIQKGNPVITAGINFSDLRINYKYIKRYMFDIDIENYTLSQKDHWRGFQKWGTSPNAGRSEWTGDVGFKFVSSDFNPIILGKTKKRPAGYYKLTTYEGITGYFVDRRKPAEVKANKPWKDIRVNIPIKSLVDSEGHMKIKFDFWPFLKFMIDQKGWVPGFPLGGPLGNEIYNNKELSNNFSRATGFVKINRISHWIVSDLPPKKEIPKFCTNRNKCLEINLKDYFSLPMMRKPIRGELPSHKWPKIDPKFKLLQKSKAGVASCSLTGEKLNIKGLSKGTATLTVRCYDEFHEWYDDKEITVIVN
jgi:hypothetical protein